MTKCNCAKHPNVSWNDIVEIMNNYNEGWNHSKILYTVYCIVIYV